MDGDLTLPEFGKSGEAAACRIRRFPGQNSGTLRAVKLVPGGTIDPGKIVSGLARAAELSLASIFENTEVKEIEFGDAVRMHVDGGQVLAKSVLLATNAMSLELGDLAGRAQSKFTLGVATEPLSSTQIEALGLGSGKPFYTIDFPYLWGRLLHSGGVVFGAGLVLRKIGAN